MVDNVKLSTEIGAYISRPNTSGDKIVFGNIEMVGCPNTRDLNTYTYKAQQKNIVFTLTNQTFRISNSLHKFATGENYSDFNLSQLKIVIEAIENLTQQSADKIAIHTCELALNIETELPGKEYLSKFSLYNYNKPRDMMSSKTHYGIKYVLSEYSIKIYDKREHYKSQYNKDIGKNMLRFEIKYTKARRLKGLKYLSDFFNEDKIRIAYTDFFSIITKLRCVIAKDIRTLNGKEMSFYFAGQDTNYWEAERRRDKEATKYKKKLYKEITKKANETNLMPMFIKLLKSKLEVLLNN